jgi:hypothetical protein
MSDANPSVDLQDPLPESNWLWRRVFVFAVTACVLWMVWGAITRLGASAMLRPELGIPALLSLCQWLIAMVGVMVTYYMIAPSAEQMVKMLKTAALLRSGVQVSGTQVVRTPDGSTETAKTVGLPPAPPAPALGAETGPSLAVDSGDAGDGPPWAGQRGNIPLTPPPRDPDSPMPPRPQR